MMDMMITSKKQLSCRLVIIKVVVTIFIIVVCTLCVIRFILLDIKYDDPIES